MEYIQEGPYGKVRKDLLLQGRLTEASGKAEYIKLAQSLPTYGTTFFLVKVRILVINSVFLGN